MEPILGVMILAHRRHKLLNLICEQARTICPNAVIQITLDRPTEEVKFAAEATGAELFNLPFAVLDDTGEHYMPARQWQFERLPACDYAVLWDDDQILEDPTEALEIYVKFDLVYVTKAFLWNSLNYQNIKIPTHSSVFFFRRLLNDAFSRDRKRMLHAPEAVHDDPHSQRTTLRGRLLDIGYLIETERVRVATDYFRAGKIDSATMALVDEPILRPFGSNSIWYEKLKNVCSS